MRDYPKHPSIIITMGPSIKDEELLKQILSGKVTHVRFNMSHGSKDEHLERLELVRRVAKHLQKDINVFADLCGPKLRVLELDNDEMILSSGDRVTISHEKIVGKDKKFSISYPDLYLSVQKNTKIALDDGKILLEVVEIVDKDIVCTVVRGGKLLSEKGVNVLDTDLPIDAFTEKDKEDALFALENNFDALSLSFVKKKEDIIMLRTFLAKHTDKNLPIIAKIETKQALHAIDGIIEEADVIMIARGDLGIEIPIEEIPIVQKELAYVARKMQTPVIVATEIFKSMTRNPFPTRAEITDCVDALIDGASYLMLSDETTVGTYPKEVIEVMTNAIDEFLVHQEKYTPFEKQ